MTGLELRKNWILKKRAWMGTLSEILIPIIAFGILMIIRSVVEIDHTDEEVQHGNSDSIDSAGLYVLH